MVKRYTTGEPINTEAVVKAVAASDFSDFPFEHKTENGQFVFSFKMADDDIIYGLGEAPRGINKRGWIYQSYCSDDPFHTEQVRHFHRLPRQDPLGYRLHKSRRRRDHD